MILIWLASGVKTLTKTRGKMMANWVRVLANPAVLKRFLGTKAGKRAMFKFGNMLINSKTVRRAIGNFINRNGQSLRGNREYKKLEKKYAELEKRVDTLVAELEQSQATEREIQTKTFTLGRQVVEMQRLYAQMELELNKMRQQQMMSAQLQHAR